MNIDGANNHPQLAWGKTRKAPFLKAEQIDETTLTLPLQIVFDEPYPKNYEMADFLMLGAQFANSEKFKNCFEKLNIYGVQFVPIEITSNKGDVISGHYAAHFWNKLSAIDKDNYVGDPLDMFETIPNLSKFSLDAKLLTNIPLEKRLVFGLTEDKTIIIVHQSVYEAIQAANLTGMRFFRVDDWDESKYI
jgi:hypothetical protein